MIRFLMMKRDFPKDHANPQRFSTLVEHATRLLSATRRAPPLLPDSNPPQVCLLFPPLPLADRTSGFASG
jgi:hypothetical protein